jgi:hypothetical protein
VQVAVANDRTRCIAVVHRRWLKVSKGSCAVYQHVDQGHRKQPRAASLAYSPTRRTYNMPRAAALKVQSAQNWHQTGTSLPRKTKKSAGANRLTLVFLGSPTWARTRDLRINRLSLILSAKPHECSLSGPTVSNILHSGYSLGTPDKPREYHWILDDSVHMIQLTSGASLASLMLFSVRLNVDPKSGQGTPMPGVPLNVSDGIQSRPMARNALGQDPTMSRPTRQSGRRLLVGGRRTFCARTFISLV